MRNLINIFDDLGWEKAKDYPEDTFMKTLRDDKDGRTIVLKIPKGFKMAVSYTHLTLPTKRIV